MRRGARTLGSVAGQGRGEGISGRRSRQRTGLRRGDHRASVRQNNRTRGSRTLAAPCSVTTYGLRVRLESLGNAFSNARRSGSRAGVLQTGRGSRPAFYMATGEGDRLQVVYRATFHARPAAFQESGRSSQGMPVSFREMANTRVPGIRVFRGSRFPIFAPRISIDINPKRKHGGGGRSR